MLLHPYNIFLENNILICVYICTPAHTCVHLSPAPHPPKDSRICVCLCTHGFMNDPRVTCQYAIDTSIDFCNCLTTVCTNIKKEKKSTKVASLIGKGMVMYQERIYSNRYWRWLLKILIPSFVFSTLLINMIYLSVLRSRIILRVILDTFELLT